MVDTVRQVSTFWDGSGGALIGSAASGAIAVIAIVRTRRDQRFLMREQMSLSAAYEAIHFAAETRRRTDPFVHTHLSEATISWNALAKFLDRAAGDAERFYAYRSVIRPTRIGDHLVAIWEELISAADDASKSTAMLEARNAEAVDDWARNLDQALTNLIDELDAYLRADHERQEWRRLPVWRRYKLTKRPPFLRKSQRMDRRNDDAYGMAERDY